MTESAGDNRVIGPVQIIACAHRLPKVKMSRPFLILAVVSSYLNVSIHPETGQQPHQPNPYRPVYVRRESRVFLFLTGRREPFPETLFSLLPCNGVSDLAYAASK